MTRNGGREAFESQDGGFVYYAKADVPGIWKSSVEGGEETQVLVQAWSGSGALLEHGIYRLQLETSRSSVVFFSFATRWVSRIVDLPREVKASMYPRGFAVSPDERWILFQHADFIESGIMLESFQ